MTDLSESKVDLLQLKTLLRTAWKTDLRNSGNPMNPSANRSRGLPPLLAVMMVKLFIGIGLAVLTFFIRDPFMSSFLVVSTMVVFLAMTVMLEFSNLILNPEDYKIMAVQPVSSKTFFAAKVIHLLAYVNTLAFLLYFPSAVTGAAANSNILLFPAFIAAGVLSASAIGLSFVLVYTLLLRIASREVMLRVLGYFNMTFTLMVYLGYFIAPKMLGKESLLLVREFKSGWIYLAPPAWFAAIVQLFTDQASAKDLGAAILALIVLYAVYRTGVSRLSLGYAQTLAEIVEQKESKKNKRRKGVFSGIFRAVTSGEDRAVWTLIRKQFKYDNRFKMSILGIIPLMAIYVFIGISEGETVPDPFLASLGDGRTGGNYLLYIAAAMFPYMITFGTVNSDSYRSAWVFYISPADRTRIILSSARFALVWFCLPFTLVLTGVFTWYFRNPVHAVLHCLVVYLILTVQTKIMVLLYPRIPFSQPAKTGQLSMSVMIMVFISIPVMCVPMVIISMVGYGGYMGYVIWTGGLFAVNFALFRIVNRVIPERARKMEFTAPV